MQKICKSFTWAMNGIHTAWREEMSFRFEVAAGMGVVAGGTYLHFSELEWIIVVGCITAVLAAEVVNTAIEDLCNKVEPNTDPIIGKVKDLMGGFVFIVVLGTALIGMMIFSNYF